jgi:hypothetical protein
MKDIKTWIETYPDKIVRKKLFSAFYAQDVHNKKAKSMISVLKAIPPLDNDNGFQNKLYNHLRSSYDEICAEYLDGIFTPGFTEEDQSTGYKLLKELIQTKTKPASEAEYIRWKTNPTIEELMMKPDIKYLDFLHPILRSIIRDNWDNFKKLKINFKKFKL